VISSNDNKLLIGLVQGNRKAFDAIYRQYFHAVYCNALKLTRDAAASEDMLQEVFIALWEKRATIDTTRSIGGWLFVICYNKSINILRKKLRESLACKAMRLVTMFNGPCWKKLCHGFHRRKEKCLSFANSREKPTKKPHRYFKSLNTR
jgi:RNA polymerase sigma factor (sigma-70 family)